MQGLAYVHPTESFEHPTATPGLGQRSRTGAAFLGPKAPEGGHGSSATSADPGVSDGDGRPSAFHLRFWGNWEGKRKNYIDL